MMKMKTIVIYFVISTFVVAFSAAISESFDPEAISQVSEGIAEWKLMKGDKNNSQVESIVYVSSSLTNFPIKNTEGIMLTGLSSSYYKDHWFNYNTIDRWYSVYQKVDKWHTVLQKTYDFINVGVGPDHIKAMDLAATLSSGVLLRAGLGPQVTLLMETVKLNRDLTMQQFDYASASFQEFSVQSNIGKWKNTGDPKYLRRAIYAAEPRAPFKRLNSWNKINPLPVSGEVPGLGGKWDVNITKNKFQPVSTNWYGKGIEWIKWKWDIDNFTTKSTYDYIGSGMEIHATRMRYGVPYGWDSNIHEMKTIQIKTHQRIETFFSKGRLITKVTPLPTSTVGTLSYGRFGSSWSIPKTNLNNWKWNTGIGTMRPWGISTFPKMPTYKPTYIPSSYRVKY